MNRLRMLILMLVSYTCMYSQSAELFPELKGAELHQALVDKFKPKFVETYSVARILMYTEIYNINDSVHTLYTDHTLYLPPEELMPIQYLAMEGQPDGINAEHIYPRSKGANEIFGNAYSDLHNLAPARWEVNEARSNFPFGEIDDSNTDCWFYRSYNMKSPEGIPPSQLPKYSEVDGIESPNGLFEPRDEVKGDIARSVFYFYTMYREEALQSDPEYFNKMRESLCKWQASDPVDSVEMERNLLKAMYQDGQPNPFIMDCSLANRMYCPETPILSCENLIVGLDEELFLGPALDPKIKIYPNPNQGLFTLDISNIEPADYMVDIFNGAGQLLYSIEERLDYFNSINMWNARNGMHILHITNLDTGRKYSGTFTIVR